MSCATRCARGDVRKAPGVDKVRIIGMTSCITKVAWRIAAAFHLRVSLPPPMQALFDKGGVHAVLRVLRPESVRFTADIVDAYWGVDRLRCYTTLFAAQSPLAPLFAFIYGQPPYLVCEGTRVALHRGVLPGCGGAAIAFAVDLSVAIGGVLPDTKMYADDATCLTRDALAELIRRLGPEKLSKFVVIDPGIDEPGEMVVEGCTVQVVKAAKHLGAFVGEPDAAMALMKEYLEGKLAKLDRALSLDVSLQAKFQLFGVAERAMAWTFAATHPSITSGIGSWLDEELWTRFVSTFVQYKSSLVPCALSRPLLYLPPGHGGVGITNFADDAEKLYQVAGLAIGPFERVSTEDLDGPEAQRITPAKVKREIAKAKRVNFKQGGGKGTEHVLRSRADDLPWFMVRPVVRRTRIANDAFQLGMARFLMFDDPGTPVCPKGLKKHQRLRDDHAMQCRSCAGSYFTPRHEMIVGTIVATCRDYGIAAGTSFDFLGAPKGFDPKNRPDVVVMRTALGEKPCVVDVTVTHQAWRGTDLMKGRYNHKMAKYREYCEVTGTVMVPFVISTHGAVYEASLEQMREISRLECRRGFMRDVLARIKAVLVNYQALARRWQIQRDSIGLLVTPARLNRPHVSVAMADVAVGGSGSSGSSSSGDSDDDDELAELDRLLMQPESRTQRSAAGSSLS